MKLPNVIEYRSNRLKPTVGGPRWRFMQSAQFIGAALLVLGVATSGFPAQAGASHPLDKYPGFGRSPQAALRDDTIAYWEAFQRERLVASCMSISGFQYEPDVAFPTAPMVAVGDGLAVAPSTADGLVSPTVRNVEYEAALPAKERERFNQAMFGESAADIAESNASGRVPDGRGEDFATGGCVGEAKAGIASVWDLRSQLEEALVTMRQEIAISPELSATGAEYSACARKVGDLRAASPAEVEAMMDSGDAEVSTAAAVLKECDEIWQTGYQKAELVAANRFVEQNAVALADLERRYEGVTRAIVEDHDFLRYLSEQMARSNDGD